jgi:hypothetical protein
MNILEYIGGVDNIKFLYENLNEGLIKTYDMNKCKKYLQKRFTNIINIEPSINDPYHFLKTSNKKDYFYIEIDSKFENYKEIEECVYNLCGWWTSFIILNIKDKRFPLKRTIPIIFKNYQKLKSPYSHEYEKYLDEYFEDISNNKNLYIDTLELQIEQKFTTIQKLNFKNLYHASYKRYLPNIIKKGLVPRNDTNHPDRIFFSEDYSFIKKIITKESIILRLNFDDYSEYIFDNYTFYDDTHHNNAVFTLDNIHPKYIQVLLNDKWINLTNLTKNELKQLLTNG